jgi:signal transduction histidine kinase
MYRICGIKTCQKDAFVMKSRQKTGLLFKRLPLVSVLFSIVISLGWIQWNLSRDAERFQEEFVHQNASELAAGDSLAIARRLEWLVPAVSWECIEAERSGVTFFQKKRGSCGNRLFKREILLSARENPAIKIKLTLTPPIEHFVVTSILVSGQIFLFVLLWFSGRKVEREIANATLQKERADNATARAVASSVQMVAHDVRKPFSSLEISLSLLSGANSMSEVSTIVSLVGTEVSKSLKRVNGLLSDLMEVGARSTQAFMEPASPTGLLHQSMPEACKLFPHADLHFEYDLQHSSNVHVDILKVERLIGNLLTNAIQALPMQKGNIWFSTREHEKMVEFTVGNTGYIPPAVRSQLFESFFTHGKKGGTGLGLVICKKMAEAHGGTIWCHSEKNEDYPEGKAEFSFTLPVAPLMLDELSISFPQTGRQAIESKHPGFSTLS